MTKECIFCGTAPTTKEHIFSGWLSVILLEDPARLALPLTHKLRGESGVRTWVGGRAIEIAAKCVCVGCNAGWMNELELVAPSAHGAHD
jgi:hypothetical protein